MTTNEGVTTPVPKAVGKGWFVTSIVLISLGILLASIPGLGIPFLALALIHLIMLRRRALQAHNAWESERARNSWVEAEATRLGSMDHVQRQDELRRLDAELQNSRSLMETERLAAQRSLDEKNYQRAEVVADIDKHKNEVVYLQGQILDLKNVRDVQDYGLYDFENPADDSVKLGAELKQVQQQIKEMVKAKTAATGSTSMRYNNNLRQGQKMVADMVKLLLRSFNAEAENAVKTVKAGHLTTATKRLTKSAAAVERLGKSMDIAVNPKYLRLRERELKLTHKHLESLQAAKEEEREIRRKEREEAKAQREFLAAKAKQEKEVEHYRNVVASLRASGDEAEAEKISLVLSEAEDKLDDVERTMANTRAGYVYVASNRGAFGSRVVKIGMTRRLNPDERLKELSDASVPFNFDKHTMIFAEDAVGLENSLHKHFSDKRVNLINMRREYFYATPGEVKKALLDHEVQVLEYHEESEAVEFEASERQRRTHLAPSGTSVS